MIQPEEQLQTLHEIRNIMDRSTRFHSLSGLSGIFVGLIALTGVGAVQWYLTIHGQRYAELYSSDVSSGTYRFIALAAVAVFGLAAGSVLYFTRLKASKAHQPVWTSQARRLLVNFCLPLAVGGAFCGILLYHNIGYLVASSMLIFYGLALVNASRYTFADLRSLGLCELALGLASGFMVGYGLLAWALGFGVLHVLYGSMLYYKYEKKHD
ncbi:hypothetical protein [Salmonirosea aquatica]|uniref:Uncharacterized protein n=1 Tax=Salmonirosea aquatica TaxID=2654236 RepID=A0A7C9BBQ7_9BACT|nr:hypothetical protein [Cytophagaceae bacterium SJW1-29]